MSITSFEAAARYDLSARPAAGDRRCLVLDLERCAAGYCECTGAGEIKLAAQWAAPDARDVWSEAAARLAPGAEGALEEQLTLLNSRLSNYLLSERLRDAPALSAASRELTCAEALELLEPVLAAVRQLADEARRLAPDADDAAVILTGRAARLWIVDYAVRERLSADPLLPDARFVNSEYADAPDAIVALGEELDRKARRVGHDVALVAEDETGAERELALAARDQDRAELASPAYVGPMFIADGDAVRVRVDGALRELALPYASGPSGGDLIDVAAGCGDKGPELVIRRTLFPTRIYRVGLA